MATKTQVNKPDDDQILDADFSNVEERRGGGRQAHVPPGDYLLKVIDARVIGVKSDPSGKKKQVKWDFLIIDGETGLGGRLTEYASLDKDATGGMWKLYNILSDLADGKDIPKSAVKVNLASKVGLPIGAFLEDDEPWRRDDGTVVEKSRIATTYAPSKFISPNKPAAVTPEQAAVRPAQPVQNGASAADVAAAIVQPSEEDKDIQPLPTMPVAEI